MAVIKFRPEMSAQIVLAQMQANGMPVQGYANQIAMVIQQLDQQGIFIAGLDSSRTVQEIFRRMGAQMPSPPPPRPAPVQQQSGPVYAHPSAPAPNPGNNLPFGPAPVYAGADQPPSLTEPQTRPSAPTILD